jgi:hemin uptake protein HemP
MSASPAAFSMPHPSSLAQAGGGPALPEATRPASTLESAELLKGGKMVGILHNGALYRLQATRLGKLILTK